MKIRMAGFQPNRAKTVISKNKDNPETRVNRSITSAKLTPASLYTHRIAPVAGQRWRFAKRVPIVKPETNILETTE